MYLNYFITFIKKTIMKKLLLIVIFTAFSCSSPKTETHLTRDNLKGKVKSHTLIYYDAEYNFGKLKKLGFNPNTPLVEGLDISKNWYIKNKDLRP